MTKHRVDKTAGQQNKIYIYIQKLPLKRRFVFYQTSFQPILVRIPEKKKISIKYTRIRSFQENKQMIKERESVPTKVGWRENARHRLGKWELCLMMSHWHYTRYF